MTKSCNSPTRKSVREYDFDHSFRHLRQGSKEQLTSVSLSAFGNKSTPEHVRKNGAVRSSSLAMALRLFVITVLHYLATETRYTTLQLSEMDGKHQVTTGSHQ